MSDALGPLMVDIAGTVLDGEDREVLAHPLVGGVILFSRNYRDPRQVAALVDEIRSVRASLLVAVDQEGGRVQRLRDGFTPLPAPRLLTHDFAHEPAAARTRCRLAGWLMAAELRAVGVDISFAPVLDLDRGRSSVIGDRAFADSATAVGRLAGAFAAGMAQAGMSATGKHFPGHGAVGEDSHLTLPQDPRPFDAIEEDMRPFAELARAQLIAAVMMAHVCYPQVDDWPASLSRRWIDDVLRGRLGFQGAVFCDDLGMAGAAVAGDATARARRALQAGCDMLPVCNDRAAVVDVLDRLGTVAAHGRSDRLAALRGRGTPPSLAALQATDGWRRARSAVTAGYA